MAPDTYEAAGRRFLPHSHVKKTDGEALMARLRRDAEKLAGHFGLNYREIARERPNVRRRYGICTAEGRIALRLNHARSGQPLKYSSLINTLCHELAHLRHFNHGPRFKSFYLEILNYARREGVYRPGKEPERAWTQLELFPEREVPGAGHRDAAGP